MRKPYSMPAVAVVVLVGGCAAAPPGPGVDAAGAGAAALSPPTEAAALPEPDMVVDMSSADVGDETRCEDVTRPGSRIVVSRRCWSRGREVDDEERLAAQLEQVRRDQDELERRQRDIEEQRRRGFGGL